ncbi:MAG: 7-cyano-7-deazaguanine synthase QueC [Candidatus Cloacimonadota bacterium]|nr:MAG: 7-cyano-7-deazaguanine synthase QueC [Candidatus Cloacimonadota bacterium]
MTKGIILVSGGMDSLVTVGIAEKECDEIYFLHVNYGQKTECKEKECFYKLKEYYKPKDTLEADISYLTKIGGSSLTDHSLEICDHDENFEGVPDSYVPFRNAHLICIAVSWAEVIGAEKIYIGAVEEDSSGYPDCREVFYENLGKAVDLGTKDETKIQIITPIIHKTKAEIAKLGKKLNVPFQYSWSCYRKNDVACGVCDSCYLRLKAFREAGLKDPIPYEVKINA